MAVHAYLISFEQPMPAALRGQESVRAKTVGIAFNLDPAGA